MGGFFLIKPTAIKSKFFFDPLGDRSKKVDFVIELGAVDFFSTQSYSFELPSELIATEALKKRDDSRLLVADRARRTIEHRLFQEFPEILGARNQASVLSQAGRYRVVANNSKVLKSRLIGKRVGTEGRVEFFLLKQISSLRWTGLMRAAGKINPGFEFEILAKKNADRVFGRVIQREEAPDGAIFIAEFNVDPLGSGLGQTPLPPYILAQRKTPINHQEEIEFYNTVFASQAGSVASPTAGRHFTPEMISNLKKKEISWDEITLHVGLGTFRPVTSADIRNHQLHEETATIDAALSQELNQWKQSGNKILAVGTTTARTLEGMTDPHQKTIYEGTREINLFIYPGSKHTWTQVDALLTNFHLPESSLLMMVADFIGDPEWTMKIYQEAISKRYRFYSYGDAMLIF